MSQDEEMAQAQIDAASNTAQLEGRAKPPRLSEWSPLADAIASVGEEVRALKIVMIKANSKKGSQTPEWKPFPRPVGVMSKLLKRKRWENHKTLRARLLPDKYGEGAVAPRVETEEAKKWDPRSPNIRRR